MTRGHAQDTGRHYSYPIATPRRAGGHYVQRKGAKVAIQTPKGRMVVEGKNVPWAKNLYDQLVTMTCEKDETPEALYERALEAIA